jgi:hypothetical protein
LATSRKRQIQSNSLRYILIPVSSLFDQYCDVARVKGRWAGPARCYDIPWHEVIPKGDSAGTTSKFWRHDILPDFCLIFAKPYTPYNY